jgi:signal recognition particle receptor subunit beta
MVVAKDELGMMLDNRDMHHRRVPLLIFANKCDERGALSAVEVSQLLSLERVRGRPWHICASCATTGVGLAEGVEWLSAAIKHYYEHDAATA